MKYSTIIGLVLLVVGLILFIVQDPVYYEQKEFYIAGFLGLGTGLFIGGIMGYAQKKRTKVVKTTLKPANETLPKAELDSTTTTREENGVKF